MIFLNPCLLVKYQEGNRILCNYLPLAQISPALLLCVMGVGKQVTEVRQ